MKIPIIHFTSELDNLGEVMVIVIFNLIELKGLFDLKISMYRMMT